MTKGLKRILSMVIAVVMVVGMVPTNALHVHAVTDDGKIELNANNGDLPVNTSVEDAAEHRVGLKSKVLKAAGLPENGNYTVTTVVNIELGPRAVDVTLRIDENGVVVNGDWGYLQSVFAELQ